ncbi:MAG: heparan-alpha-glucosaminide N-acetyltransferase domain-containing protein [Acutalibacteraceae bacterium]|nr:heparan-alpha-glucosaminide N-acetyltransferase domain-containing protein [Acutalibacteraceae bacterium]
MADKKRYIILDEIRGFAIICMVFFHAFFTFAYLFGWQMFDVLFRFFMPAEPFFAFVFIFISGVCAKLTRSNLKRGLYLSVVALLLTLVTVFLEKVCNMQAVAIYFGILHLLSICMITYPVFDKLISKIPILAGVIIFTLLTVLTFDVSVGYIKFFGIQIAELPLEWYSNNLFMPLGFPDLFFTSSDYFPLIPWLFAFLAGACFGRYVAADRLPPFCSKMHIRPFAYCGRHSLIIYILHQPVIYAIGYLITLIQ